MNAMDIEFNIKSSIEPKTIEMRFSLKDYPELYGIIRLKVKALVLKIKTENVVKRLRNRKN